ncbi:MAG: hypothetical protein JST54_25560 [Deltaproteobacteria bacterium]|nr:hypothetical protein [Deltaproteobacteria bacterium]
MTRILIGAAAAAALTLAGATSRADDSGATTPSSDTSNVQGQSNDMGTSTQPYQDQAGQGQSGAQGSQAMPSSGSQQQEQTASGTIKSKSATSLTVSVAGQPDVTLLTSPSTVIVDSNGLPIKLDAVQEGQQIRASYRMDSGQNKADQLLIVTSGGQQQQQKPADQFQQKLDQDQKQLQHDQQQQNQQQYPNP